MSQPRADEKHRPEPGAPVTVALDGSDYANTAADWAAREAVRRGAPLRLLTVVASDVEAAVLLGDLTVDARWDEELEDVLNLLADTEARLRAQHPDLKVRRDAVAGDVVHELRAAAHQAGLLVVGSRGRGGIAGTTLGSVSLRLASAAACPLVVVPKSHAAGAHPGPAVVGVDGHEIVEVLSYGLEHAERTGGGLRVVHAWNPYPAHSAGLYVSDSDITARQAAEHVADWLDAAHSDEFGVKVDISVQRGRPGEVLVEQSHTADLVVIGSHRRVLPWVGGVGAVLHHVLMHAHCPVAVVPVH